MKKFIQIDKKDNVFVALQNLKAGTLIELEQSSFSVVDDIPAKHKFFIRDMSQGDEIIMYGVLVGKAQNFIPKGGLMTTVNTKHATLSYAYRNTGYRWNAPDVSRFANQTFNGYLRSNGNVGTANYWLFIPTVFCENRNLDVIREALHNELGYTVTEKYKLKTKHLINLYRQGKEIINDPLDISESDVAVNRTFANVDGIKFLNHQGGCGGTRQDSAILSKLLAAYADHPNVAGVTVLSLGCQNMQVQDFLNDLKKRNPEFDKPLHIFEQQQSQSEDELITSAIKKTFLGLIEIN